jgi:membrane protease YdiL (CAAX protease family)
MSHDDHNHVKPLHVDELNDPPRPASETTGTDWQPPYAQTPPPPFRAAIPDDLRVPWGWREIAMFVFLGAIGTVIVTWGMSEAAVKIFGIPRSELFGDTMSTAKSVLVLISQALLDSGAILYLYLMLLTRTPDPAVPAAPFWRTIGWREIPRRAGSGTAASQHPAVQFLAGGALLAVVVTFLGSFANSKETLPIEELLKARVSMFLFAVLGVLVAPLVEETVFRGFLYPVIARRLGIAAGILITGVLFGLMHAAQLWGGWVQIALLIGVGITLTSSCFLLTWTVFDSFDLWCAVLFFAALSEVKRTQDESCAT